LLVSAGFDDTCRISCEVLATGFDAPKTATIVTLAEKEKGRAKAHMDKISKLSADLTCANLAGPRCDNWTAIQRLIALDHRSEKSNYQSGGRRAGPPSKVRTALSAAWRPSAQICADRTDGGVTKEVGALPIVGREILPVLMPPDYPSLRSRENIILRYAPIFASTFSASSPSPAISLFDKLLLPWRSLPLAQASTGPHVQVFEQAPFGSRESCSD
jgi:hypothetical protein